MGELGIFYPTIPGGESVTTKTFNGTFNSLSLNDEFMQIRNNIITNKNGVIYINLYSTQGGTPLGYLSMEYNNPFRYSNSLSISTPSGVDYVIESEVNTILQWYEISAPHISMYALVSQPGEGEATYTDITNDFFTSGDIINTVVSIDIIYWD